jgi:Tubulin-tyrosine ligase family
MVDAPLSDSPSLRVTLLEVNSNPCLEFSCPLLEQVITRVVEDTFRCALPDVYCYCVVLVITLGLALAVAQRQPIGS